MQRDYTDNEIATLLHPGGIRTRNYLIDKNDDLLVPVMEKTVSLPCGHRASDYEIAMTSGRVRNLEDISHNEIGSPMKYKGETYMIHDFRHPQSEDDVDESINFMPLLVAVVSVIGSLFAISFFYSVLPGHTAPLASLVWSIGMGISAFYFLRKTPLVSGYNTELTIIPTWNNYEHDYQIVHDYEPWLMSSFHDDVYRAQVYGDAQALRNATEIVEKSWDTWRKRHAHPEDK